MRQAKRNGTFDLGILEIKGRRLGAVVEACTPVEIYTDHPARDLSLLHDIQCDKGVLWDESEQVY